MNTLQQYLHERLAGDNPSPNALRAGELDEYGLMVGIIQISAHEADYLENTLGIAMDESVWWIESDGKGRVGSYELRTALEVCQAVQDLVHEDDTYLAWLYRSQRDPKLEIIK